MSMAIAIFRECLGLRPPSLKAVKKRAEQLGFSYAQLYHVAGNWWLSLAASACADAVLCASGRVPVASECWIITQHSQGPLLLVWRNGQLMRVAQQSLQRCADEYKQHQQNPNETAHKTVVCQHYGCLTGLPSPWSEVAESQPPSVQSLVALAQLPSIPLFKKKRRLRYVTGAIVLLLVGVAILLGVNGLQPDKKVVSPVPDTTTEPLQLSYLPLTAVMDEVLAVARHPWQGPWQLTQVNVKQAVLNAHYQAYTPLALYSADEALELPPSANGGQRLQQVNTTPLQVSAQPLLTMLSVWQADRLQHELLIEQRPGLMLKRLGRRWQFEWQGWGLTQVQELATRLQDSALVLQELKLLNTAIGWQGQLVLTQPTPQPEPI